MDTWRRAALLALGLAACRAPVAAAPARAPGAGAGRPAHVELTEGQPATIGPGVTVTLKSAVYAHLADGHGDMLMQLIASHDGQARDVMLERMDPGPERYQTVFGLRLCIDYLDAYNRPVTGAILVQPE